MKYVYFVRHGESEFNAGAAKRAEDEIALTPRGHEQAEFLAQRATKLSVDVIISSTLLRARQTAQHIADATGKPIETSDLFIERCYPSAGMGLTVHHPEVVEIERLMIEKFGEVDYLHSDEETFAEIKERTIKAFDYLEGRKEDHILVVTHGIFLRMVVAVALFGKALEAPEAGKVAKVFKTKNTGLTLLQYGMDEKSTYTPWTIRTWNDHAHLG